ncbi:MAG: class I SAM-dependent RNA methyltransferase [Alphaproteobacteria bacterium]|nr:class I SAM-dependent RNA methyltransferase [Alphaproteobacteria bacterium]
MVQPPDTTMQAEVIVLGHSGDGVILHEGRKIFVPYAAPGDRLELKMMEGGKDRAVITRIVTASGSRVTPPCPHFGDCGGCALQHLSDPFVADWKRQSIIDALAHRGLRDVTVRPTLTMPVATRRRAAFAVEQGASGVRIGFSARHSHRLVAISDCAVLDRRILLALPGLRDLLTFFARGQTARLLVTQTETGLDVDVHTGAGGKGGPGLRVRNLLAAAAARLDLARLSLNGETMLERRKPLVLMGQVAVCPPPGAFLQASIEGQAALIALVMEGLDTVVSGKGTRILDLFAGCGTFSFPVAHHARVHAAEGDRAMTDAMRTAARETQGVRQIEVSQRDLQRSPFTAEELGVYSAVIFDPPRTGAQAQAAQLAASRVNRVIAVSCAPASFARDARALVNGGFQLRWAAPVDQFRWSAELELVALFERA